MLQVGHLMQTLTTMEMFGDGDTLNGEIHSFLCGICLCWFSPGTPASSHILKDVLVRLIGYPKV